jgi:hypothetical protein
MYTLAFAPLHPNTTAPCRRHKTSFSSVHHPFSPKDTGLSLCGDSDVQQAVVQISDLVRLGSDNGDEQRVVFTVPASEFDKLWLQASQSAGDKGAWRMWVVEGQCSLVQARRSGHGSGTWELSVGAATVRELWGRR